MARRARTSASAVKKHTPESAEPTTWQERIAQQDDPRFPNSAFEAAKNAAFHALGQMPITNREGKKTTLFEAADELHWENFKAPALRIANDAAMNVLLKNYPSEIGTEINHILSDFGLKGPSIIAENTHAAGKQIGIIQEAARTAFFKALEHEKEQETTRLPH